MTTATFQGVKLLKIQLLHMMTVFLMREQESYKQALLNSDTLHLISTGIQNNIAQQIEDLETASKRYKATYSIGSKTNVSKSRRKN